MELLRSTGGMRRRLMQSVQPPVPLRRAAQKHVGPACVGPSVTRFSSKRRTRYGGDADRKRTDKLFSSLRVKQQEQLKKLREALVRDDREAAAQQERARLANGEAVLLAIDENATNAFATSESVDSLADVARRRRQMREFSRMMARKAARQERVKHLPLFRDDSPLWHRFGPHSLLDYEHLPALAFDGPVAVIHSADEEQAYTQYLQMQQVIGVDTESMPRFDQRARANPVCLVQIATLDRSFLYRLDRGAALPPYLRSMLENPGVIKIGHSLDDDFRLLERSKLVSAVNTTLDTLPVASKLGCLRPGLKTLCQLFLGGNISKEMQVSNWESPELSDDQIRYAATDAWAPLRVMLEMIQLEDSQPLLRIKSYNPQKSNARQSSLDNVLAILQECVLDYHSRNQM